LILTECLYSVHVNLNLFFCLIQILQIKLCLVLQILCYLSVLTWKLVSLLQKVFEKFFILCFHLLIDVIVCNLVCFIINEAYFLIAIAILQWIVRFQWWFSFWYIRILRIVHWIFWSMSRCLLHLWYISILLCFHYI